MSITCIKRSSDFNYQGKPGRGRQKGRGNEHQKESKRSCRERLFNKYYLHMRVLHQHWNLHL